MDAKKHKNGRFLKVMETFFKEMVDENIVGHSQEKKVYTLYQEFKRKQAMMAIMGKIPTTLQFSSNSY